MSLLVVAAERRSANFPSLRLKKWKKEIIRNAENVKRLQLSNEAIDSQDLAKEFLNKVGGSMRLTPQKTMSGPLEDVLEIAGGVVEILHGLFFSKKNEPPRSKPQGIYGKQRQRTFTPQQTTRNSLIKKQSHQEVISINVYCKNKFQIAEKDFLIKYGDTFQKLINGSLTPETDLQKHFVDVFRKKLSPETWFEKVWVKYLYYKKKYPFLKKPADIQLLEKSEKDRRISDLSISPNIPDIIKNSSFFVCATNVKQERGFFYYIDNNGNLVRHPWVKGKKRPDKNSVELIAKLNIQKEDGYHYYMAGDGNIYKKKKSDGKKQEMVKPEKESETGVRWTEDEIRKLKNEFAKGKTIKELAILFRKLPYEVKRQLTKL